MDEAPVPTPIAALSERNLWREIHNLQGDVRELYKVQQSSAVLDARIQEQMQRVQNDVDRVELAIATREASIVLELSKRVTFDRYRVTEMIVFGVVALFGSAIIAAVAALIFKGTHP
jgi:hypothetical protein